MFWIDWNYSFLQHAVASTLSLLSFGKDFKDFSVLSYIERIYEEILSKRIYDEEIFPLVTRTSFLSSKKKKKKKKKKKGEKQKSGLQTFSILSCNLLAG